jgi:hypothetical protein
MLADVGVRFTAVEGVEVVPVVEHVCSEFLCLCRCSADVRVVGVLGVKLDCDAYV